MSIRFITDSQRVKVLRSLHRYGLSAKQPLTSESIEFLLAYIETLETELERTTGAPYTDTIASLAEQDSYYMARATAALRSSSNHK
jgi:hypothetical protein